VIAQSLLAVLAGAASPIELTYVGSANSTTASITIPAGAQQGDIGILCDFGRQLSGSPTLVTPSGWTVIDTLGSGAPLVRTSYRILGSSPGGSTVTGMDANFADAKTMLVFRPSRPITSVGLAGLNGEYAPSSNPSPQVVAAASGAPGLVVIGVYCASAAVSPRSFSPTEDGEVVSGTTNYMKYKIYNSSPADVTVDMDNEAAYNFLQSFYMSPS